MKFLSISILLFFSLLFTQCEDVPTDEEKRMTIETILAEYNDCKANAENNHDCKSFIARAICEYNGLDDLKKYGDFIEYNEIYDFIKAVGSWESLGFAPDQSVMTTAQDLVNKGYAVIAINTEDKHKLPVLIVKGELSKSTKWSAEVPSCAAFFPASSKLESFINKTINYAWSKPDGVEFFVKR
jgi:hypothetical protein